MAQALSSSPFTMAAWFSIHGNRIQGPDLDCYSISEAGFAARFVVSTVIAVIAIANWGTRARIRVRVRI